MTNTMKDFGYVVSIPEGMKLYRFGPSSHTEQFGLNGPIYTWETWPGGHWRNCRIDGRLISPVAFKKRRAERDHVFKR